MNKNPLEASSYLSNFAKLMRSILNNSSKEFITLVEEIETIENYLKLQKLRFPNKFEYEVIVAENLDTEELLIPPMLAQPFIENAINHGIANLSGKTGKIEVDFQLATNKIVLTITDNGTGLTENKPLGKHVSMATEITKNRIRNFKKTYKQSVNFTITNLANEKNDLTGVKVDFNLPLKYQD